MTCKDCPALIFPKAAYIVYSGGMDESFYKLVGHPIPEQDENIILQYGWPSVDERGWIHYTGGQAPPRPEGYEAVDERTFKPVWPSCSYRMLRVELQDSGLLRVDGMCINLLTGKRRWDGPISDETPNQVNVGKYINSSADNL